MNKFCILSDFDGTITEKDGLYTFIQQYAKGDWQKIEQDWAEGLISSKECLIEEFNLVPDLSPELIEKFVKTLNIDNCFIEFYNFLRSKNIDFYIVSDGIDYFINKILEKHNLNDINIISNHGEFQRNEFKLTFPNDNERCINNAGTCKCAILSNLKQKYEQIYYIGDGVSDYCVADKADLLFAKSRLQTYCENKNIDYIGYKNFNDIQKHFVNNLIYQ